MTKLTPVRNAANVVATDLPDGVYRLRTNSSLLQHYVGTDAPVPGSPSWIDVGTTLDAAPVIVGPARVWTTSTFEVDAFYEKQDTLSTGSGSDPQTSANTASIVSLGNTVSSLETDVNTAIADASSALSAAQAVQSALDTLNSDNATQTELDAAVSTINTSLASKAAAGGTPTNGQILSWNATNSQYEPVDAPTGAAVMSGADGTNAGTAGAVPAPAATDNTKFLRGDGTWTDTPSGGSVDLSDGTGTEIGNVAPFTKAYFDAVEVGGNDLLVPATPTEDVIWGFDFSATATIGLTLGTGLSIAGTVVSADVYSDATGKAGFSTVGNVLFGSQASYDALSAAEQNDGTIYIIG